MLQNQSRSFKHTDIDQYQCEASLFLYQPAAKDGKLPFTSIWRKKTISFLNIFFRTSFYIVTEYKWDPLGGLWIMPIWPRAGIKIIFGWAEGSKEKSRARYTLSWPLAWPMQLFGRPHHLIFLLAWPRKGQKSEDSLQILIKIQDFSFYCIRCLTTIILIGKKFIYTNKLTLNHKALLFVFQL